ncbi:MULTISPECIES: peptidoglycan-binding domain-containing protein [Streptomyces]|uniref:Peptidoglycan-binding domain-containing protein n=1 Tax=Streptomyces cremeus TaxID=66881 RepID=A0ABV5PF22_STRCM
MKKLFTALASAVLVLGLGVGAAGTAGAVAPAAAPQVVAGSCGYYNGTQLTVRGHTGDRVREVQCLLVHVWGIGVGPQGVDGKFGANTEGAVRQFQQWYGGLAVDGKVGVNTWAALRS